MAAIEVYALRYARALGPRGHMHRLLGLTLLALLAACHEDGAVDTTGADTDTTGADTDTTGDPPATFAEVQTQVLDNCSGFGPMSCHQSAPLRSRTRPEIESSSTAHRHASAAFLVLRDHAS